MWQMGGEWGEVGSTLGFSLAAKLEASTVHMGTVVLVTAGAIGRPGSPVLALPQTTADGYRPYGYKAGS